MKAGLGVVAAAEAAAGDAALAAAATAAVGDADVDALADERLCGLACDGEAASLCFLSDTAAAVSAEGEVDVDLPAWSDMEDNFLLASAAGGVEVFVRSIFFLSADDAVVVDVEEVKEELLGDNEDDEDVSTSSVCAGCIGE